MKEVLFYTLLILGWIIVYIASKNLLLTFIGTAMILLFQLKDTLGE